MTRKKGKRARRKSGPSGTGDAGKIVTTSDTGGIDRSASKNRKMRRAKHLGKIVFVFGLLLTGVGFYLKEILHEELTAWDTQIAEAKKAEDRGDSDFMTQAQNLQMTLRIQQMKDSVPHVEDSTVSLGRMQDELLILAQTNASTRAQLDHISDVIDAFTNRPNQLAVERDALKVEYETIDSETQTTAEQAARLSSGPEWPKHAIVLVEVLRVVAFDLKVIILEDSVSTAAKGVREILQERIKHYEHMRWFVFYSGLVLTAVGFFLGSGSAVNHE